MLDVLALRGIPIFSVVIPVFDEAEVLPEFHRRLSAVMDRLGTWEAVYVNDGSRDASLRLLEALHRSEQRVAIVNLSRNFGKEIATTAGLEYASGEAVIVIDADLQDPPEVIPQLVAGWRDGFDMVYAERRARDGETWPKRATSGLFYRLMQHLGRVQLPRNTGDFRLMSRRVVDAVLQLREQHRLMKGLFAWVGFPTIAVQYDRAPRQAGTTKWNYWKLWNLALDGITGLPVQLIGIPKSLANQIDRVYPPFCQATFFVSFFKSSAPVKRHHDCSFRSVDIQSGQQWEAVRLCRRA
jgi:polyisoprenyl-phosphate glycosyltransferase